MRAVICFRRAGGIKRDSRETESSFGRTFHVFLWESPDLPTLLLGWPGAAPRRVLGLEPAQQSWSVASVAEGMGAEDLAMARYAAGDDAALAIVYDAIAPRLHGYLRRRTQDASLCDDLVQKTFLQMHRARSTFVTGALVAPWAFAIAKRLLIDASRTRSRQRARFSDGVDGALDVASGEPDAEDFLAAKELGTRAAAVLQGMPKNQRDAFLLLRVDGLSVVEAAEVLGTTVSAVKLRAHRAYKVLADALGDLNVSGGTDPMEGAGE